MTPPGGAPSLQQDHGHRRRDQQEERRGDAEAESDRCDRETIGCRLLLVFFVLDLFVLFDFGVTVEFGGKHRGWRFRRRVRHGDLPL